MNNDKITRREFIEKTTLTVASASVLPSVLESEVEAKTTLPQRVLGRTGVKVPIIAFGCGSRFLMYENEDEATRTLNHVIDSGITYLDTAMDYGKGLSETRVGMVMKTRRKDVWLATKVSPDARTRDAAWREVDKILKRLQTDHVYLLHLHGVGEEDHPAK